MDHPSEEELVAFVYGEATGDERTRITSHLRECDECRETVNTWRVVGARLDTWRIDDGTRARGFWSGGLRLAAAAVLLVAAGIGIGILVRPASVDVDALRAALEPQIAASVQEKVAGAAAEEARQAAIETGTAVAERVYGELVDAVGGDLRRLALDAASTKALVVDLAEAVDRARTEDRLVTAAVLEELESRRRDDYWRLANGIQVLAAATADELVATKGSIDTLRANIVETAGNESVQNQTNDSEGSVR